MSSNIMSDVQYRCLMENRAKGRDNRRETNFYISITKAPADYTITVAKSPTPTTVLMPNQVCWSTVRDFDGGGGNRR